MARENAAAWLVRRGAGRVEVGLAPYPRVRADQIVVRNHAVAVNPVDLIIASLGGTVAPWLSYPTVLGSDIAGEVVEVGESVTRFAVGDRVLGHAAGVEKDRNAPAEGAFQLHTVLFEHMACPIPGATPDEDAAVLPLGLSTAACALFEPDLLALPPAALSPAAGAPRTGHTVLVWGGSTSVGSNTIQLARAAGHDVIATASPHNAEYVLGLGASAVLDYRSPTVVADLIDALSGHSFGGAVAIGIGSTAPCVAVAAAVGGRKLVATTSPPVGFDGLVRGRRLSRLAGSATFLLALGRAQASITWRARRNGVRVRSISGGALRNDEVGPTIYRDFLPTALATGRFTPAPPPLVVGAGLHAVQLGLETLQHGVSARKVVITL